MRKLLLALFAQLVVACFVLAQQASDPALATVRIKSHGGSGTVIVTAPGKSLILSCAHMFLDDNNQPSAEARKRPLKIDGPSQPLAPQIKVQARLAAYDYDLDLSLIELDNGPFYYLPVAEPGFKPGAQIVSIGYDDMRWPVTSKSATILFSLGNTTFTREKPWHGRSGGGLIDVQARKLIGVVQGYEVGPQGRGLYVSHQAVLTFLQKHQQQPRQQPQQMQLPQPRQQFLPFCPPGG